MRTHDPAKRPVRRDGWTARRQLAFLAVLARTRSVAAAARVVGMSREGAYRLRARDPHGLFAAAWARALRPARWPAARAEVDQGHRSALRHALVPEGSRLRPNPPHGQPRDLSGAPEGNEVEEVEGPPVHSLGASGGGSSPFSLGRGDG